MSIQETIIITLSCIFIHGSIVYIMNLKSMFSYVVVWVGMILSSLIFLVTSIADPNLNEEIIVKIILQFFLLTNYITFLTRRSKRYESQRIKKG